MFEKFKSIQWFDLDKREKRQLLKLLKKQRKFQVHFYENGITFKTDEGIENIIRTSPFPILNLYWFHKNNNVACLSFGISSESMKRPTYQFEGPNLKNRLAAHRSKKGTIIPYPWILEIIQKPGISRSVILGKKSNANFCQWWRHVLKIFLV